MKQLFILTVFLFSAYANGQTENPEKKSRTFENFNRFDIGYEHSELMANNGWNTRSFAFQYERSFKSSPVSGNYRFCFGVNDSSEFYMHMPAGPLAGVLMFVAAVSSNSGCNGSDLGLLLFIVPGGFGFNPIQNDRVSFGVYADILSLDYCNSNRLNKYNKPAKWDYAPDFGARFNYYVKNDLYFFSKLSAKYSVQFGGWGSAGTIGLGFQFEK